MIKHHLIVVLRVNQIRQTALFWYLRVFDAVSPRSVALVLFGISTGCLQADLLHLCQYSVILNMESTEAKGNQSRGPQELLCLAPLRGTYALWFLVVCNVFIATTAASANTVILAALSKESSLHPPSKMFLRSLALTDLCVGLLLKPLFVTFLMSIEYESWKDVCHHLITSTFVTGQFLCLLSLFTLTAISVDRLLALLLGLRYRHVATFKRVLIIVICLWTLSMGFQSRCSVFER